MNMSKTKNKNNENEHNHTDYVEKIFLISQYRLDKREFFCRVKVDEDFTSDDIKTDRDYHFDEGLDECIEQENIRWEEGVEVEPIDYRDLIMGRGEKEMIDPQEYKDNRDIPTYDFYIKQEYDGDFYIGDFLVMGEDLEEQE